MLKHPKSWLLFVVLAGLAGMCWHIGQTQMPASSALKPGVETPSAKAKEGDAKQDPIAASTENQPPAEKYEKDCPDPQKRGECIIQVRTAEATEAQARYTQYSLYLVGATIVLTLGTVVAGFFTLSTMRDTDRKQLRAYVFTKPSHLEFNGTIPKAVHFIVVNSGQTPAYRMKVFNAFLFLPFPLPDSFDPGRPDDKSVQTTNVLAPNDPMPFKRDLGQRVTPQMEIQMKADTHRYYAFAVVHYRDVFRYWLFWQRNKRSRMCASVPGPQMLAGMYAAKGVQTDIRWDFDHQHNDAD